MKSNDKRKCDQLQFVNFNGKWPESHCCAFAVGMDGDSGQPGLPAPSLHLHRRMAECLTEIPDNPVKGKATSHYCNYVNIHPIQCNAIQSPYYPHPGHPGESTCPGKMGLCQPRDWRVD